MILVTGAAGKTGQAVIKALGKRKTAVRALVHKETKIQTVQALGIQDIVVGDMGSQAIMEQALQGINAIYHICPNVNPYELNIGQTVIQAARTAEVERFVFHSVFHPQIESMTHHWQKMRVEEQLFESGLAYTILQPAPYMQNIMAYWQDIVTNGKYALPYSGDTRLGCVDLEDVAEVAALVLNESGHEGAIYELCSVTNLSQNEMAQIISHYVDRPVEIQAISVKEWAGNARRGDNVRKNGLSDYQVQTLSAMFRYYDQFGYVGNSRILAYLLNRPPTSFAAFIERMVGNLKNDLPS